MLGAVLTVGNLKHTGHTEQRLLGVPVRHHLEEKQHPHILHQNKYNVGINAQCVFSRYVLLKAKQHTNKKKLWK